LAQSAAIVVDPARALFIVRAYDCDDNPAPNVKFDIEYVGDDGGDLPQPYTILGRLPFTPPTRSDFLPTDDDGQGGFANVPFGAVRVFASTDGVDGQPIAIGPDVGVSATAGPGQITVVEVHAQAFGRLPAPATAAQ
jgi:hypothetical protein